MLALKGLERKLKLIEFFSLNIHLYTLQRFTSIGLYWINTEIKQSTMKTKISKICNEIRAGGGGGGGGAGDGGGGG